MHTLMPGPFLSTFYMLTIFTYYPHFMDERTEVERGQVSYPQPHSWREEEFKLMDSGSRVYAVNQDTM